MEFSLQYDRLLGNDRSFGLRACFNAIGAMRADANAWHSTISGDRRLPNLQCIAYVQRQLLKVLNSRNEPRLSFAMANESSVSNSSPRRRLHLGTTMLSAGRGMSE